MRYRSRHHPGIAGTAHSSASSTMTCASRRRGSSTPARARRGPPTRAWGCPRGATGTGGDGVGRVRVEVTDPGSSAGAGHRVTGGGDTEPRHGGGAAGWPSPQLTDQLADTSALKRRTASASETPCSRTRDFQVENATAWPRTPRVRRAAAPRRRPRPAMRVSCAATK